MGIKIGYARVSTKDQSLEIQLTALNKECNKAHIYQEKVSGTGKAAREQLRECLDFIREGDTLVITKLDRLARSMGDLMTIKTKLKAKGATLQILDQPALNDSSLTGDLMFNIMGAIAEFETGIRSERQIEGVAAALAKGTHFGATAKLSGQQIEEMKAGREAGMLIRELMEKYSLSKSSVYRLMK